MPIGRY
ncbi:2f0a4aa4-12d5-4d6a-babc-0268ae2a8439 [Thermothielavioides terrestris]|nr:2f0a4aa4-12d5-4d6a-babc-0268ae2a8439 [Thermothielavioides terrestris]